MSASSDKAPGQREPVPRAIQTVLDALEKLRFGAIVKRRSKGTPDRRRRGTPFSDNMMLVC